MRDFHGNQRVLLSRVRGIVSQSRLDVQVNLNGSLIGDKRQISRRVNDQRYGTIAIIGDDGPAGIIAEGSARVVTVDCVYGRSTNLKHAIRVLSYRGWPVEGHSLTRTIDDGQSSSTVRTSRRHNVVDCSRLAWVSDRDVEFNLVSSTSIVEGARGLV